MPLPRNALYAPDQVLPDPTNPLAGNMTLADAWDVTGPALAQNARDTYAAASDPQFWIEAARHYGNALLMGTIAPGVRMPSGMVDIGEVTAHINPSRSDIARMMEAAPEYSLRALVEGPNHAIWPAYDATHAEMAAPLGFTKDAARLKYHGRVGPQDDYFTQRAGRFSFAPVDQN